jgi:hypothetical protein
MDPDMSQRTAVLIKTGILFIIDTLISPAKLFAIFTCRADFDAGSTG